MSATAKYVIGLDFGTDSVRALLVNTLNGHELAVAVFEYPRWKAGKFIDAGTSMFRQHPLDYIEGTETTIKAVIQHLNQEERKNIIAISVDTTGSTPVAVDQFGTPLSLLPQFAENPNAMFVLWKDHTAVKEANEINNLAHSWYVDYTKYVGGIYSAEWFWSKILYITRVDEEVRNAAFTWVEHCDWIPALLTGNNNALNIKRSRCAAGHKAMWHPEFDGLPSEEFLSTLDPLLKNLRANLYQETYTSDFSVGSISKEWALKLGLSEKLVIGVGALDAHFGAVGASIEPFSLVKVIGTSTCDMITVPLEGYEQSLVKGICGQVLGSIVPNLIGMEAGQSAFGDYYAWLKNVISFPLDQLLNAQLTPQQLETVKSNLIPELSKKAALLPITINDEVALDWINGRRTPDANQNLKAAITGLHLGSDAVSLFKSIVEATAFGSKAIIERFNAQGIKIDKVIAVGGIAKKSDYVIQTLANILNVPIAVVSSNQVCALGAAMFAAVVAQVYPNLSVAQQNMSSGFDKVILPDSAKAKIYEQLFIKYQKLGVFIETEQS